MRFYVTAKNLIFSYVLGGTVLSLINMIRKKWMLKKFICSTLRCHCFLRYPIHIEKSARGFKCADQQRDDDDDDDENHPKRIVRSNKICANCWWSLVPWVNLYEYILSKDIWNYCVEHVWCLLYVYNTIKNKGWVFSF